MEIKIVEPSGFCFGVKKAIEIAKKAKNENKDRQIYIIGSLVHNEDVIEDLENDGFLILDERKKSLEEYLRELNEGSVIVFSAHGHSPVLDEIALEKHMKIYDATCIFVKNNERKAYKEINDDNEVIFIGIPNHAETNGIMGVSKEKVHLYQPNTIFNYAKLKSKKPLVISQTTMSEDEISSSIKDIKNHLPEAIISARQCFETERRQSEAIKEGKDHDCFVIIGGKNSNNTKRLFLILKSAYPNKESLFVLNEIELKNHLSTLKQYNKIMLVSGASTSDSTISSCYKLLNEEIECTSNKNE